jgi:hypothetical protein
MTFDVAVSQRAQILCLNFIKYYSSWLHVLPQLSLLDDYFIVYENTMSSITVNRAQINVTQTKS